MESPASHHGTERPEAKNSAVLLPERLPKNSAGTKQMATESERDDPVECVKLHRKLRVYSAGPRFGVKECDRRIRNRSARPARAHFGEIGAAAEDHGAAAETGAGEARAEGAGGHGGIHQAVERRATDLQAVAQAGVRIQQQAAEAPAASASMASTAWRTRRASVTTCRKAGGRVFRRGQRAEFLLGAAGDGFAVRGETGFAQSLRARRATAL